MIGKKWKCTMQSEMVLLFVYDIDRGNLSGMSDYRYGMTSSKTPRCHLFALISSPVGVKKAWKRFINDLGFPSRFLHRDEFFQMCGTQKLPVPAIYIQSGKSFHELIKADEINRLDSTDVLIGLVTQRLKQFLT
jgi:hypothetical protein